MANVPVGGALDDLLADIGQHLELGLVDVQVDLVAIDPVDDIGRQSLRVAAKQAVLDGEVADVAIGGQLEVIDRPEVLRVSAVGRRASVQTRDRQRLARSRRWWPSRSW